MQRATGTETPYIATAGLNVGGERLSVFDVVFGLVVFVSVAFGYFRGGVREMFALLAFGLAAVAAVFVLPAGVWLFAFLVHPRWLAVIAAVVVVFVSAYLVVRMAGASATARLRASSLGGADRLTGAGIGLLRALILLGLASLLLESAPWPQQRPGWMRHSLSYPVARGAGRVVARIAPSGGQAAGGLLRFVTARLITDLQEPEAPPRGGRGPSDAAPRTAMATGLGRDERVWAGGSR